MSKKEIINGINIDRSDPDFKSMDRKCLCGFIGDNYEIVVYEFDKYQIPHFHIIDSKTKGKKFNCRIKIESPAYLEIKGKKNDHLDNTQIELLCKEIRRRWLYGVKRKQIWNQWCSNNTPCKFPHFIPDYKKGLKSCLCLVIK